MNLALGVLGALAGSYLNVLSLRFSPEEGFRASRKGRSRCLYCRKTLKWYELIPLVSFIIQGGKCRSCRHFLSFQYPIVELLSALVFILIPWKLGWSAITVLWILTFLVFIIVAVIDLRLGIIPDKLNLLLVVLGLLIAGFTYFQNNFTSSLLGSYALLFQFGEGNFWINRLAGISFGLLFLGAIYFFTKGKAMGFGDVKLAGALGLLLGWPDAALALVLAFLVGSFFVLPLLLTRKKALRDALPFGPFMVLGVTLVFFFGYHILNGYFQIIGLYAP
ncbi:MAG: prepilin peptidase [Candidatus Colwellbacteria bacterium]|nr:prepilin peptidase [Candidatus Colwellbacteria bacterium]